MGVVGCDNGTGGLAIAVHSATGTAGNSPVLNTHVSYPIHSPWAVILTVIYLIYIYIYLHSKKGSMYINCASSQAWRIVSLWVTRQLGTFSTPTRPNGPWSNRVASRLVWVARVSSNEDAERPIAEIKRSCLPCSPVPVEKGFRSYSEHRTEKTTKQDRCALSVETCRSTFA